MANNKLPNIRVFFAGAALLLCNSVTAAVIDITFDDTSSPPFPGFVIDSLVTPQGFEFVGGFSPKYITPRTGGDAGDNSLSTQTAAGAGAGNDIGVISMINSNGFRFDLLQMDVFVLDPTTQQNYLSYPDFFTLAGYDAADNLVASLDVSWLDGTGWRTITFDSSWTGLASVRLDMLDNCCTEIERGEWDNIKVNVIPLPPALLLLASGLAALLGFARRP